MNMQQSTITEIHQLHSEICGAIRTNLEKAIRIGELLTEVKDGLDHGEWLPWLKVHVPFSDRTARNYLRVFEKRDALKLETVSDLTEGYRLLRSPEKKTDAKPDAECIPQPGEALLGITPHRGGHDAIWIMPSTSAGFYFVNVFHCDFRDEPEALIGGSVDGLTKPLRADYIDPFLRGRGINCELIKWEAIDWEGTWSWNNMLFSSEQDSINQTVLGKVA